MMRLSVSANHTIDSIGEEAAGLAGIAQVHNGQHFCGGARESQALGPSWNQVLLTLQCSKCQQRQASRKRRKGPDEHLMSSRDKLEII